MGAQGTTVIDFGATPTSEASIAITGQTSITGTSLAEAFIMGGSTGTNTTDDHRFAAVSLKLICDTVVAGTGFTIYAVATAGEATGTFNVKWVWN
jgi:hypothetical protein